MNSATKSLSARQCKGSFWLGFRSFKGWKKGPERVVVIVSQARKGLVYTVGLKHYSRCFLWGFRI